MPGRDGRVGEAAASGVVKLVLAGRQPNRPVATIGWPDPARDVVAAGGPAQERGKGDGLIETFCGPLVDVSLAQLVEAGDAVLA